MIIPSLPAQTSGRRRRRAKPDAPSNRPSEARSRIMTAALRAFAERGFHGTSVPDIAAAARVGVGSIYRHFESKERLVNAVFRDAKARLRDSLLLDFDMSRPEGAIFADLWFRLVRFQRAEPFAFQFLEMQDHVPYLDGESRALEASLLAPLLAAASRPSGPADDTPALVIAIVWGAFVGLTKAERLGYISLDDAKLRRAGEICFASVAFALALRSPDDAEAAILSPPKAKKSTRRQ